MTTTICGTKACDQVEQRTQALAHPPIYSRWTGDAACAFSSLLIHSDVSFVVSAVKPLLETD